MKPKLFIGSSVEGLNIAYSIQQNLTHDAEVTVWDQGVFDLSKTTIESLIDALKKVDFGIFVFSPDDELKMRNQDINTIRDNVLFEFGLFTGQLGRERVYFIIPSEPKFHLPTDILGVTPGKYDPNREDKSLQAATGPVCHQIRQQIKKIGTLSKNEETNIEPKLEDNITKSHSEWIKHFTDREYAKAISILEIKMKDEIDDEKRLNQEAFIGYCKFKLDEVTGKKILEEILANNSSNGDIFAFIARIYFWENYYDKAEELLNISFEKFGDKPEFIILRGLIYQTSEGDEKAIEYLMSHMQDAIVDAEVSLSLASIFIEQENLLDARDIIHKAYKLYPQNVDLRFKYATLAISLGENEVALFILNGLVEEFPTDHRYLGYMSNALVNLDLDDLALETVKEANKLAEGKEAWLQSNIGNILKNKGLHLESIEYFKKAIEIKENDTYAHVKLASAIEGREDSKTRKRALIKEGQIKLRKFPMDAKVSLPF